MKILDKLKEKLQSMTLSQTAYPVLSAIFLVLIVVLFTIAARTISTLINDTVKENVPGTNPFSVDQENFLIVAHKLGINTKTETETGTQSAAQATTTANTPQPQEKLPIATTAPSTIVLIPKEINVAIYNGTTVRGGALRLKTLIAQAGFNVVHIGNAKTLVGVTILQMKKSKGAYQSLLTNALGNNYTPKEITQEIPENGEYDVIIILGGAP